MAAATDPTRRARARVRVVLGVVGAGLAVISLWLPWMVEREAETTAITQRWWFGDLLPVSVFLGVAVVGLTARIVLGPGALAVRAMTWAGFGLVVVLCAVLVVGAGILIADGDWFRSGQRVVETVVVLVGLGIAAWSRRSRRWVLPLCGVTGVALALLVAPGVQTVSYTDALSAEAASGAGLASLGFAVLAVADRLGADRAEPAAERQ